MARHEDYATDRTGGLWDRVWRGRASSHRRSLANAALYASRCATALGEAARLIDTAPGDRRAAEIGALALQIRDLAEGMIAIADHLSAEARGG